MSRREEPTEGRVSFLILGEQRQMLIVCHGYFGAEDWVYARTLRGFPKANRASETIVIRERKRFQSKLVRAGDERFRRASPIEQGKETVGM